MCVHLCPCARVRAPMRVCVRSGTGLGDGAGTGFATSTQRISANGARVNLAATLAHHSGVQIRLAYEGDLRSNFQGHTGLLRASMPF